MHASRCVRWPAGEKLGLIYCHQRKSQVPHSRPCTHCTYKRNHNETLVPTHYNRNFGPGPRELFFSVFIFVFCFHGAISAQLVSINLESGAETVLTTHADDFSCRSPVRCSQGILYLSREVRVWVVVSVRAKDGFFL